MKIVQNSTNLLNLKFRENKKQVLHPQSQNKNVDQLQIKQNLPYNKDLTIKNSEV